MYGDLRCRGPEHAYDDRLQVAEHDRNRRRGQDRVELQSQSAKCTRIEQNYATHRNRGANIRARDDAADEDRGPHADIRRLEPVQRHELPLHRERIVACERIKQARARRERRHGRHELRERDDREAHEREPRADRVVVELRNRDRVRRARDGRDALHGEEEREHVREPDEPRSDDAPDDSERREDLGALGFFGDLSGSLAAFEGVDGLEEPEKDHEAAAGPSCEAEKASIYIVRQRDSPSGTYFS